MTDDQDGVANIGENSVAEWAGYTLGRNLHSVRGWQTQLWRIAGDPDCPWDVLPPNDLFCSTCDEPPSDRFEEIDVALRELALLHCVYASVLVEVHRSIDKLHATCCETSQFVREDERQTVYDLFWESHSVWDEAVKLSQACLADRDAESSWGLGAAIWDLLRTMLLTDEPHVYRPVLDKVVFHIEQKDGVEVPPKLRELQERVAEFPEHHSLATLGQVQSDLTTELVALDENLRSTFAKRQCSTPLIVFDDATECLKICGERFDFTEFRQAKGGLDCMRVLVQHPGRPISASFIIENADITIEPEQLGPYFSRFRGVVKSAVESWSDGIVDPEKRKIAQLAFVISVRQKRGSHKGPVYKLDLPPKHVRHIPSHRRRQEQVSRPHGLS